MGYLKRISLNLSTFPCTYVDTPNGKACHMKLPEIPICKLPTVSILTPTYNRKLFVDLMIRNWNSIDYPKDKLEWIIVDDSDTGKELNKELFQLPNVRYIRIQQKIKLGKKRNFAASLAKNEILIHMDDDDFYPPESVIARVKTLMISEGKNCTGCTKTLCYDLIHDQTFEAFDASDDDKTLPCTVSESSLAYTKQFWKEQNFNDDDTNGECLNFMKDRHNQIITIPYIFVVTQLSHSNNTVKRWMLKNTQHTVQFTDNLSLMDSMLIQNLRARIICEFPEWKEAISFVKKLSSKNKKQTMKLLEKNPKFKTNPLVIDHYRSYVTKTTTTDKEITYYCGPGRYLNFNNTWNGTTKGLGGSEEAVVNLSEQFVKLGYNVTVYNVCDKDTECNGVKYKQYWKWIPGDKCNTTIIWRDPSLLDIGINSSNIYLDLHDVIDKNWLTDNRMDNVTKIFCKSDFHSSLIGETKVIVVPNGIKNFKQNAPCRNPYKIVSTSSPDRCITALLHALPIIRKEIPEAEIYWAYGFKSGINKGGMESHEDPEIKNWVLETKKLITETPGFHDLGRISHSEVSKLMKSSNIFAYGTSFPEIDCISMTKAMASGCIPVVTPTAALEYKLKYSNGIVSSQCKQSQKSRLVGDRIDYSVVGSDFDTWVQSIISQLKTDVSEKQRSVMANMVYVDYGWESVAKKLLFNAS